MEDEWSDKRRGRTKKTEGRMDRGAKDGWINAGLAGCLDGWINGTEMERRQESEWMEKQMLM